MNVTITDAGPDTLGSLDLALTNAMAAMPDGRSRAPHTERAVRCDTLADLFRRRAAVWFAIATQAYRNPAVPAALGRAASECSVTDEARAETWDARADAWTRPARRH